MSLILGIIDLLNTYRLTQAEIQHVIRFLSLYEKELTILALAQRKKGERKNANPNP